MKSCRCWKSSQRMSTRRVAFLSLRWKTPGNKTCIWFFFFYKIGSHLCVPVTWNKMCCRVQEPVVAWSRKLWRNVLLVLYCVFLSNLIYLCTYVTEGNNMPRSTVSSVRFCCHFTLSSLVQYFTLFTFQKNDKKHIVMEGNWQAQLSF